MMKSLVSPVIVTLLFLLSSPSVEAQALRNSITFDNQSGDPALVKVVGPTAQVVEVPNGEKRTVNVAAGEYYILARYAADPRGHTYSRGDPFKVEETATQYSVITITLHKVVGGNYPTRPTAREEFDRINPELASHAIASPRTGDANPQAGQPEEPPSKRPKQGAVQSLSPDVAIIASLTAPGLTEAQNLEPPYSPPPITPAKKDHHFILVLVKAAFPKGDAWDLAEFTLHDAQNRAHLVVAVKFVDEERLSPLLSHMLVQKAASGALGVARKEKPGGILPIIKYPPGTLKPEPNKVSFPLGGWPGGPGFIVLVFEVPTTENAFTLRRSNK